MITEGEMPAARTSSTRRRAAAPVSPYDWGDRQHWNGGRRQPCRYCGKPSFLLDHELRPCHKVCYQARLDKEAGLKIAS